MTLTPFSVAIIGDRDSVLPFKALGVATFPVLDSRQAARTLEEVSKEGYLVCFITEEFARELEDLIGALREAPRPIVVPIPSRMGSTGLGMENLKVNMRKATGADILFERGI